MLTKAFTLVSSTLDLHTTSIFGFWKGTLNLITNYSANQGGHYETKIVITTV